MRTLASPTLRYAIRGPRGNIVVRALPSWDVAERIIHESYPMGQPCVDPRSRLTGMAEVRWR